MRGVRFNILDVQVHSDPSNRDGNQIISAARRLYYAGELSAKPRF
jgi:elongation factor 2